MLYDEWQSKNANQKKFDRNLDEELRLRIKIKSNVTLNLNYCIDLFRTLIL